MIYLLLATFAISFAIVAFMLPHVMVLSLRKRLIDPIDPRKVHSVAASRLGGITFYPAIIFSVELSIVVVSLVSPVMCSRIVIDRVITVETLSLLMLFLIGIYDDIIGVTYKHKFVVQILAALLIVVSGTYFKTLNGLFGLYEIPGYVGALLTLGFYIFVTNSINLIDGIDGLASSLSMMALVVYTALLFNRGFVEESLITIAALGALLPFWYGNVFGIKRGVRSKIFMGDTGALLIGALLGFSAVTIWNSSYTDGGVAPFGRQYSVLVYTMLLIPSFDVVRIVIHRYLDKKPLFLPDRNHIHHKFISLGYTPRKSLLHIVSLNMLFFVVNLTLSFVVDIIYIVVIDIVLWTTIQISLSRRIKNRNKI